MRHPGADALLGGFRFEVSFTEHLLGDKAGEVVELCRGAFSECSGLEASMEPKVIREGGRNWGVVQRAGRVNFATVVLKRGLTRCGDLWAWFSLVGQRAYAHRLDVVITLFDGAGQGVMSWSLVNALPVKFKAPDLNASNSEVVIEELHLAHEGLARIKPLRQNLATAGAGGG